MRGDLFERQQLQTFLSVRRITAWVANDQVKFKPDQLVWDSHRQTILISHWNNSPKFDYAKQ